MKSTTATALVMIAIGAVLLGVSYVMVGGDVKGFNSMNNKYIEKTYTCESEIDSITIKEQSGKVVLKSGDVEAVTVSYSDREDESVYRISEENGKLSVIHDEKFSFRFFNINFTERVMTVTVPKSFKGGLDIANSSGSMHLTDITGESVAVKNTSGSIHLTNVTSGSDVTVENTSGSISLENVDAQGDVSVKGVSGSIKLSGLKAGGNITLKNTSGSIKGSIVGKESDYSIRAKVVSGSTNLTNSEGGSKELNASTTSGSIKIEFIG